MEAVLTDTKEKKKTGISTGLGLLGKFHCFCGFLIFGLGIAALVQDNYAGTVGNGIWCGCIIFLTGIFGVVAGNSKNRPMIWTLLIMSVVSFLLSVVVFGFSVYSLVYYRTPCPYPPYGPSLNGKYNVCERMLVVSCMLAISGPAETMAAIISIYLCIKTLRSPAFFLNAGVPPTPYVIETREK